VPASAHAFSGLVYRQVVEMLRGVRDEAATRELIVRENMRYARRQLIWFRKEPNVRWLEGPGESPVALASARDLVAAFLQSADAG
jgi:tRNA dimethylallyltransferase